MPTRFLILRRRHIALLSALVLAAGVFATVLSPAAVTASGAVRQLPIYCVERDQKVCSISFDAAWGDGIMRLPYLCGFAVAWHLHKLVTGRLIWLFLRFSELQNKPTFLRECGWTSKRRLRGRERKPMQGVGRHLASGQFSRRPWRL